MNQDKKHIEKIRQQLIEAHGKITYTYTAHHKLADRIIQTDKMIRTVQIILTAVSTVGFLGNIITNQTYLCWVGGITATLSLGLNLYSKDFKLQTDARAHKDAADELWAIREKYVSLLTDLDYLPEETIIQKRDELTEAISKINKKYPGTNRWGYKKARKVLKKEEEQTFNAGEAEQFLPSSFRREK